MKKNSWGGGGGGEQPATNYEILSAPMVGRRKKISVSKRIQRIEKPNICRRQLM